MQTSRGVSLSIVVAETELAPGGYLHGEVKVEVDLTHPKGLVYEAIRLVFLAVEKSCVWDDQGEFDTLLDAYTSSRVYLDRHVTLSGFKTPTEDEETAVQAREEMLFSQHCATPYAAVAPAKPRRSAYHHYTREELLSSNIPMTIDSTRVCGGTTSHDVGGHTHPHCPGVAQAGRGLHTAATATAGSGEVELPVLMPGIHRFPFLFRLPPWLPPSFYYEFVGAKGELHYSASAAMLFPDKGGGAWWFRFNDDAEAALQRVHNAFQQTSSASAYPLLPHHFGERRTATQSHGQGTQGTAIGGEKGVSKSRTGTEGNADTVVSGNHRLAKTTSISPSDLTASVRFDVLSVLPRRQLVAEYYQVDRHNLPQRPTNAPHGDGDVADGKSDARKEFNHDARTGTVLTPSRAAEPLEYHKGSQLALSALYQTFRCGWLRNMFCLQPFNALEAEVVVVGARTILLADNAGASQALGVRPPTTPLRPHLGGLALHVPSESPPRDFAVASADVPWPVGGVTLRVRVLNHCPTHTVRCVRVELKVMVEIFKTLKTPHIFPGVSYSSFDYTTPIPPSNEALFDVRLGVTPRFRRHETDSASLLPPPGVRTANMASYTFFQVSFPGMHTYVEEEEETKGVVILAEAVDLNDEVLELPVRYS